MDAWETLLKNSRIAIGDAWEHFASLYKTGPHDALIYLRNDPMIEKKLYFIQNSPVTIDIALSDSLGKDFDLTDHTATLYISKFFGLKEILSIPLLIPLDEFGIPTGILQIDIDKETALQLIPGTFQYSIFLNPPVDDSYQIITGQVIISPTVYTTIPDL